MARKKEPSANTRKYGLGGEPEALFHYGVVDHHTRCRLFDDNQRELSEALSGFTIELWAEDRSSEYFRQRALVGRRLFNWLASAHSLVDVTRRLINAPPFEEKDRADASAVIDSDFASFIDELRHATIHDIIPFVAASATTGSTGPTVPSLNWLKQQLMAILEERAKDPRNPKAGKAVAYLAEHDDLMDASKLTSTFYQQLTSYLAAMRKRLEGLSVVAAEALAGADNPEPIYISPATRAFLISKISKKP